MAAHRKFAYALLLTRYKLEFTDLPDPLQAAITLHQRRHAADLHSEASYTEADRLGEQLEAWYDDEDEAAAADAAPAADNGAVLARLFAAGNTSLSEHKLRNAGWHGPVQAGMVVGDYRLRRAVLSPLFVISKADAR